MLLCYEVAPIDSGIVILLFSNVFYFEKNTNNILGLGSSKYPVRPWSFTEVFASDRTERWKALSPRFWTISFNDMMVEIVFTEVRQVHESSESVSSDVALSSFLGTSYLSKVAPF